jgi:hypothetical protein
MMMDGLSFNEIQNAIKKRNIYLSDHVQERAEERNIDLNEGFFNIIKDENIVKYNSYIHNHTGNSCISIVYKSRHGKSIYLVFAESEVDDSKYTLVTASHFDKQYFRRSNNEFVYEYTVA